MGVSQASKKLRMGQYVASFQRDTYQALPTHAYQP